MSESVSVGGTKESGDAKNVPTRYSVTSRLYSISPWISNTFANTIQQINIGSNSISKLEVVSQLNIISQTQQIYGWWSDRTPQYNPKIYMGTTTQTIANGWIQDQTLDYNPLSDWPSSYQSATQKH